MNNTREKAATNAGKINDTKFSLKDGNVHIFPFIIRNGYQNVTEVGFVPKGENPYWYSFFQKVFTGSETITATWEDSTELNVRDASLGTYNYDFKVGKYYEGMIVPGTHTQTMEINDVNGNEGFLAMQESGEITIVFSRNENDEEDTDFIPTEEDLYKLYIIPESKFQNKWLYISNVTTYNNPKNKANILTEVTFTSLKDKLETSGRALEQYVQYAAPGEPYAFPFVYEGSVYVSPARIYERAVHPVKYLQVELQGANAFSSVIVLGRRLYWDSENLKWYTSPSKFLLPYRFANPQANTFAKTSSPSKNFYCFPDETVETRSSKEWLDAVKAEGSSIAPIQNMGAFTLGSNSDYDNDGKHKSNILVNGRHTDYFDSSWKPLSYFHTETTTITKEIDTPGNVYCSNKVIYTYNDTMQQILIKNAMCNITQLELPLDMSQTKPYRWSSVPVIGFWTRWFGDRAMFSISTQVKTNHICYFIDTNLATLARNAYVEGTATPSGYGNLQMFNGEDAPSMLNPQAANTTICFELSDKVSFTDSAYYDQTELANGIDTVYFSQITKEDGTTYFHSDHTPVLLNCADSNINVKYVDYGFVIDNVIVNALHIGKIKVSCYSQNQALTLESPLFTQTVMSNSMFESNNIRNWTTNITLGTWDSNWSNGEITWPLAPQKLGDGVILNAVGRYYDSNDIVNEWQLSYNWHIGKNGLDANGGAGSSNFPYFERKATVKEEDITYLSCGFTDRADFYDKVGFIKLTLDGSIFQTQKVNFNGNNKYILLDMKNVVNNSLNKTQSVFCLDWDDTDPIFVGETDSSVTYKSSTSGGISKTSAGLTSRFIITITFNEGAFHIKIEEWQKIFLKATIVEELTQFCGMYVPRSGGVNTYKTQLKINKIEFVNK